MPYSETKRTQCVPTFSEQLDRSNYLNKTQLKKCGWNDLLILEFLGDPDAIRRGGNEHLYSASRVQAAIDSSPFPRAAYERRLARRQAAQQDRARKTARIAERFPELPCELIQEAVRKRLDFYMPSEVGYLEGIATEFYWNQLGYSVHGNPNGYVVEGNDAIPVFRTTWLQELYIDRSPVDVWSKYCERFKSKNIAFTEILRLANRLQKVRRRHDFYPLKDRWIIKNQEHLVEGRLSRYEGNSCWTCSGSGRLRGDARCWDCDGTGKFSPRRLFEHRFNIEGREYCFHSYEWPVKLSEQPGANLTHYGHPFLPSELPVPSQSLLIDALRIGWENIHTNDSHFAQN